MKKLIIAVCVVVLSGCVIQKQPMPLSYYNDLSYRDISAEQCVALNLMNYQTAAAAKNFNLQDLNRWNYDPALYQNALAEATKRIDAQPLKKKDCDNLAISVTQRQLQDQQNYQQQRLAIQQQQANSQSMMAMENARPKRTYCYKEGNRKVCNTY